MNQTIQKNLKESLDKLINTAESIVITTHFRPDHDAICSTLALYYCISKNYPQKKIRVAVEGQKDDTWEKLYNSEKIEWVENLEAGVGECDLLILTDANNWTRATKNPQSVKKLKCRKVYIDHHQTEGNDQFELKYIDKTAAAATQIIAEEFFLDMANTPKEVLEILLLGILGDTGKLAFITGKNARVLQTVQEIIEAGNIKVEELVSRFWKINHEELRIIARLLENTHFAQIENKPNIMYSFLENNFLKMNPIIVQNAYHNFISTYLRKVDGYPWGFVVIPISREEYKVSFRSTNGGSNVRKIAEHFGGGGHDPAAACVIKKKDSTAQKICQIVLNSL